MDEAKLVGRGILVGKQLKVRMRIACEGERRAHQSRKIVLELINPLAPRALMRDVVSEPLPLPRIWTTAQV